MTARMVWVDLETTGLIANIHDAWEVAAVVTDADGKPVSKHLWQLPVDLAKADPQALTVNGFYERRSDRLDEPRQVAKTLAELTHGNVLAGANPAFDARFLERLLRGHGQCPGWHYRVFCVETYAAGALGLVPPWKGLAGIAAELGLRGQTHEAMDDALLAVDVYRAVLAMDAAEAGAA